MKRIVLPLFLLILTIPSYSQKPLVYQSGKKAIKGYDAVAYHTQSTATKGSEEFQYEWEGATWDFSSQENLDLFKISPEKYAPEFGGYCAYAVSQGYTYQSNPKVWSIVEGKLYLNYSAKIKEKWENEQASYIKLGEKNWPEVLE